MRLPVSGLFCLAIALLACPPVTADDEPAELTLSVIEREYIRARGGLVALNELRSLILRGSLLQDGRTYELNVLRRRPGLLRTRIKYDHHELIQGYDGSRAWLRRRVDLQPGAVVNLDGTEGALLIHDATFESPLINHRRKKNQVTYEGVVTHGDRPCHRITVGWAGSERFEEIFLDAETFLEFASILRLGPEATPLETRYGDWRMVAGVLFPFEIESRIRDRPVNLVEIATISTNAGLLSQLFAPPVE